MDFVSGRVRGIFGSSIGPNAVFVIALNLLEDGGGFVCFEIELIHVIWPETGEPIAVRFGRV